MEKVFVAQRVAGKLIKTEHAIDAALAQAAELMADIIKGRGELQVSAVVTDDATKKVLEAMAALGEARSAMVEAHGELNEVKLRLGIRTKMAGIEQKPPPIKGSAETGLRQVG